MGGTNKQTKKTSSRFLRVGQAISESGVWPHFQKTLPVSI